jgi:hypothetical protein
MQTSARRSPLKSMKGITAAIGIAASLFFLVSAPANAASAVDEAHAVFQAFVTAQNAHDAATVESKLWNSPDFLWVTRGKQIRGTANAMQVFRSYYAATWQVAPEMENLHAVQLTPDVVQILVPITFTRGNVGETPQQARFLISQSIIHDATGWHIASIMPIADTSFK